MTGSGETGFDAPSRRERAAKIHRRELGQTAFGLLAGVEGQGGMVMGILVAIGAPSFLLL